MRADAPEAVAPVAPARRRPRRTLRGRPRRLLRALHVVAGGAWLGLVVAMLTLGVAAWTAPTVDVAAGTLRLMARVGGRVIPPVAVLTLATGFALSLLTPWGLLRHRWVVVKIGLGFAVIGTAVGLTGRWLEQAPAGPGGASPAGALVALSAVHLVMLTAATVISVDKPWGRTRRSRRHPSGGN